MRPRKERSWCPKRPAIAASSSRVTTTSKTTSPMMERVGFVGLGIMGTPMARNALKAGFAVTVTNRTIDRAKPLADAGATAVRTPREVAERSDIVVTMVTNTPDVEAVMFGPDGIASGAHDGLLAIDMSTISPAEALVFAKAQGIDLERTRQVIAGGAGSSWAMQNYAPKMLAGDFRPGFMVDLQQKDLRLVLDNAFVDHVSLPGTALVHALYNAL